MTISSGANRGINNNDSGEGSGSGRQNGGGSRRRGGGGPKSDSNREPGKTKSSFKGYSQNSTLKNKVITTGDQRAKQYSELIAAIKSYAGEKSYYGITNIIKNNKDLKEDHFFKSKLDVTNYTTTIQKNEGKDKDGSDQWVEVRIVTDPEGHGNATTRHNAEVKKETEKYNSFCEHKKAIIDILHGQLDECSLKELENKSKYT